MLWLIVVLLPFSILYLSGFTLHGNIMLLFLLDGGSCCTTAHYFNLLRYYGLPTCTNCGSLVFFCDLVAEANQVNWALFTIMCGPDADFIITFNIIFGGLDITWWPTARPFMFFIYLAYWPIGRCIYYFLMATARPLIMLLFTWPAGRCIIYYLMATARPLLLRVFRTGFGMAYGLAPLFSV